MAKRYYDSDGALIFVSSGISGGDTWMTVRQKTVRSGTHRVNSKLLPLRTSKSEAQKDLDVYAQKKGWEEAV